MIKALAATLAPLAKREKPQVFPGLAASFIKDGRAPAGPGNLVRVAALNKTTIERRRLLQLCAFLLAFFDGLVRCKREDHSRELTSTAASNDGMMLLIFAAAVTRQFRFVLTVTILQQLSPVFLR
jgi:hypothetical protein